MERRTLPLPDQLMNKKASLIFQRLKSMWKLFPHYKFGSFLILYRSWFKNVCGSNRCLKAQSRPTVQLNYRLTEKQQERVSAPDYVKASTRDRRQKGHYIKHSWVTNEPLLEVKKNPSIDSRIQVSLGSSQGCFTCIWNAYLMQVTKNIVTVLLVQWLHLICCQFLWVEHVVKIGLYSMSDHTHTMEVKVFGIKWS